MSTWECEVHGAERGGAARMKADLAGAMLGSSHTQLCFNRAELNRPAFNVDAFVRTARRCGASVEHIQADLRLYLKIIQNAMVELINEDYADFVNLSSNLVNLRRILDKLDADMGSMGGELDEYTLDIRRAAGEIGAHLDRARAAAVRREALRRRMRLFDELAALSDLLLHTLGDADDFDCVTDRFVEINALSQQLVASESDCDKETASVLCEPLRQCSDAYQRLLAPLAVASVRGGDADNFHRLLAAYEACGRLDSLLALFIAEFVEPQLHESCYSRWPAAVTKPSQLADNLGDLLRQCSQLRARYAHVLCAGSAAGRVAPLLRRAVLTSLLGALDDAGPFARILLPVDADAFATAVGHLAQFSGDWLRVCAGDDSMLRMVHSRFNFTVYVRLRTQAVKRVGDGMLPPTSAKNVGVLLQRSAEYKCSLIAHDCLQEHLQTVHFHATACLLGICAHLWSPRVYLPQVAAQFWRLCMEYLAHYQLWFTAAMQSIGPQMDGDESANCDKADGSKSTTLENGVKAEPASDDDLPATLICRLRLTAEANLVETALYDIAINLIWPVCRKLQLETGAMGECLAHGLKPVNTAAHSMVEELQSELCQLMVECASKVNHVPRQYRWTRRSAPTGPSDYVKSLRALCDRWSLSASHSALDTQLRRRIATGALVATAGRYERDARTVLTSVEKMASSLSKLKRGTRHDSPEEGRVDAATVPSDDGGGESKAAMSDDAKIRLQIAHDVRALCALARDFCGPDVDAELEDRLAKLTQLSVVGDGV